MHRFTRFRFGFYSVKNGKRIRRICDVNIICIHTHMNRADGLLKPFNSISVSYSHAPPQVNRSVCAFITNGNNSCGTETLWALPNQLVFFFLLNREANRKVWFTVDLPFAINIRNMGRTLRIIGHWMSSPTLIGNNCIWVDGIIHELMESTCTWIILMTLVRWFDGNIRFCTNNLDDECASHFGNISWEFICKMVIIWC